MATSVDLQKGDFVISEIKPGQTITITYSLTVNSIPNDESEITNIATDTGEIVDVCQPDDEDCGIAIIPIEKNKPVVPKVPEVEVPEVPGDSNNNGLEDTGLMFNKNIVGLLLSLIVIITTKYLISKENIYKIINK